jgi:hypothetical protein
MENLKNQSKNIPIIIVLFFIWPFLSFVIALRDFGNKVNRLVILSFFSLYGLLLFVNPTMDAQRRVDSFREMCLRPINNVSEIFNSLYVESTDFVEPVIMYLVSKFTDFYGVLFLVYAVIFGVFMLKFIKMFYEHYIVQNNINALIFLVLLFFVNSIVNINGFRMWTAAWIFSLGVASYLHKPSWKFILFAASAVFVHFSFIPMVLVFLLYLFFGNKTKIYGILAVISLFIAELDLEQFRKFGALFGSASENKINDYTNEDYVNKVNLMQEQSSILMKLHSKSILYFSIVLLFFIYVKTKGVFQDKITNSFYSITLLILTFANLASLMPSGVRFYTIFHIFCFATFLLYYTYEYKSSKIDIINKLGMPVFAFFIVFSIRVFMDSASFYLLMPSFFMPLAFSENISILSIF